MPAILFGSLSTVADTSELQRWAFNKAFAEHGLEWQWDRDDYLARLESSGGADRISAYAEERGEEVDAAAVHATKSRVFQESLATSGLTARAGVLETVRAAKADGWRVGFVTTTSPENVRAVLDALAPDLSVDDFDVVVDTDSAERPKPDPAAYEVALAALGEDAAGCVAIEDNLGGLAAARAAGVRCVAFPNANTAGHDFEGAAATLDTLDLERLRGVAA